MVMADDGVEVEIVEVVALLTKACDKIGMLKRTKSDPDGLQLMYLQNRIRQIQDDLIVVKR
jgi:hypothetical protein